MINYWKSLSIVLCQLSIVLACSRENEELFLAGEPEAIAFPAGSFREGWVSSNPAGATGTRVSDNTWTTGDAVGIYMLPTAVTDLTDNDVWINRKHIVDASGNLNPDGAANTLYYPLNGSGVRFVAYYPYTSGTTSTHKLTFDFADQSDKAKKEAMDFCFHHGTTSYTSASGAPALDFSHKFCKILINLSKGSGGPSCSDITASLSGMPKTAGVDLNKLSQEQTDSSTVSTAATNVTEITAYTHDGSTDDAATVEAIVAPHSGTDFAKRVFTFTTADGEEKVYELPDTVTFVAGKVYTFTLEMVAGGFSTKVADGMTNCYIVAPDAELTFPVSRAYIHDGTDFTDNLRVDDTTPYTGTFDAAIVWADAAVINGTPTVSGNGNTAEVTVKTNASVSGNAVVKICKSGETTPVWSYHIWVTDYDPNAAGATYTNTMNTNNMSKTNGRFVFMDRNLGATKASLGSGIGTGLFYQWGRKDPFPATLDPGATQPGSGSFTAVATTSTLGTIANTIKNPGVFYTAGSSSEYDWHYASRDNTLWGHDANGGTKTIYDPCPSGWRVPVNYNMSNASSPWNGFLTNNGGTFANGYNWGTNAVYPVAGFRLDSNGSLFFVGTTGYYWSASPFTNPSNYASFLYLNSSYVNVDNGSYRVRGISVRCVQE
jgi:hypothetical protein